MKKNNKIQTAKKTTKVANVKAAPEEVPVVETVTAEEPKEVKEESKVTVSQMTTKNMVGTTTSKLDANHRVELLGLADSIFRQDPNAEKKFTLEVRESVNSIVAAGVIASLADEAVYGDSTFSAVLKGAMYPQLVVTAKDMGITLPNIKSLPTDTDGNVTIESKQIKVSKPAKEQLKEEHAIEEEKPEIDPVKVAALDEEALKKALNYLLIIGPKKTNIKNTLVSVVDFMRTYRMTLADKAENTAEAKLKYDNYTVDQWLMDAFSYVKPTFLLHGIGRGLCSMVSLEKGPVSSFTILRKSLTNTDDGKVAWDDQSIADGTKAIIYLVAQSCIESEEKNLEALDKKAKDYKEVSQKYKDSIQHYKDILGWIMTPDSDYISGFMKRVDEDKDPFAIKLYNRILNEYYPGKARGGYKNMDYLVTQHLGIICNMFKPEDMKDKTFSVANLAEPVAYTEEEIKAMREAEAKAAAEKKAEESKNA